MEAFEEVSDSLCVPQYNKDGEERVILFLKMASSHAFSRSLVRRIQGAIRAALSARHVPSLILETKGIPVCQGKGCLLFSLSPWIVIKEQLSLLFKPTYVEILASQKCIRAL